MMESTLDDMLTDERIAEVETSAFSDLGALRGSPMYQRAETTLALIEYHKQAKEYARRRREDDAEYEEWRNAR